MKNQQNKPAISLVEQARQKFNQTRVACLAEKAKKIEKESQLSKAMSFNHF